MKHRLPFGERSFRIRSVQKKLCVALLLFVVLSSLANAQPQENLWQKLATFPHKIFTIQFLDMPGPPRIGFVGADSMVYRTTNGGETWLPTVASDYGFDASDFAFKDSLTGWFSNWSSTGAPYFKTTDGGVTWSAQTAPTAYCSSICYRPKQNLLFLSVWPVQGIKHSCLSTDEGLTWSVFATDPPLNGYAFLNDDSGIVTHYHDPGYLRTTDGGLTWTGVLRGGNDETWQPLADTVHQLVWAASENHQTLNVSSDGGLNFVSLLPGRKFWTTGTMRESPCGALFVEANNDPNSTSSGILRSDDGGQTWPPVTDRRGNIGPSEENDTRFYVRGSYIYAPGEDAAATTFTLWRYIGDSTEYDGGHFDRPLAASHRIEINGLQCGPTDSTFFIRYLNDCVPAVFDSARIEPPSRFRLVLRDTLPYPISGDYPIIIEHDPLFHTPDTGTLYLAYHSHGVAYYDTVRITGNVAGNRLLPHLTLLANGNPSAQVKAGDTVLLTLRLLDSISGSTGLDSILMQTSFDSTMLELAPGPDVMPPFSILRESHTLGSETLVVRHPHGEDLPAGTDIARIPYRTYLTIGREAIYSADQIRFNDTLFDDCVAAASITNSPFDITILGCGDSTLRAFMQGEPLIQILRVQSGSEPSIDLHASRDFDAEVVVFTELGIPVRTIPMSLLSGDQAVSLEGLPSGFYMIGVQYHGRSIARSRVVVVR
ncbi:MAG: hypothetical protein Q8921_05995 [Bacteroidota bacterium]|nr:hypothetical protein [Bacteroidota bacterium]